MSNSVFDAVRHHYTIVDVCELCGLELKRSGRRFVCCCPVHAEKTPSCTIFPEENRFFCFGCGAHGDAIELFRAAKGYSRPIDAALELAAAAGIPTDADKPRIKQRGKPATPTDAQLLAAFETWQRTAFFWLRKYGMWADLILEELRPRQTTDALHPLFVEALKNREFVRYLLDVLAVGTDADKVELFKLFKTEVDAIAKRCETIFSE